MQASESDASPLLEAGDALLPCWPPAYPILRPRRPIRARQFGPCDKLTSQVEGSIDRRAGCGRPKLQRCGGVRPCPTPLLMLALRTCSRLLALLLMKRIDQRIDRLPSNNPHTIMMLTTPIRSHHTTRKSRQPVRVRPQR